MLLHHYVTSISSKKMSRSSGCQSDSGCPRRGEARTRERQNTTCLAEHDLLCSPGFEPRAAYTPLGVARVMVSTAVPAPGSMYPPTGPTRDTSLPPSMSRTTCVVNGSGVGDFEQASKCVAPV